MMSCEKSYLNRIHRTAFLFDTEYIDIIRGNNQNAYTRKRKILLPHIFMQMLATTGKSQKNEISDFIEQVDENIEISQTGYFNARMKFNPDALRTILHDINRDVYAEKKLLKLNDYYIMAIDGSDFLIPKWRDNKEVWKTKLHDGDNDPVMGSASSIFDVINKCIIDISINSYKYSEKSSAEDHLGYARDILPQGSKMVCIFDRGYPSIKLIDQMLESGQYFVFRLKANDFKRECEELRDDEDDKWIDVIYDRLRSNHFREDRSFRIKLMNTTYHLRFVKFQIVLNDGRTATEILLTNLSETDFDTESMKELYHLRWDIETCYRSMKSQLKMEEFSGYREQLIKQDIYACALVYNAVSDIVCSKENLSTIQQERYKYEMAFNRNYASGKLKHYLLKIFVYYDHPKLAKKASVKMDKEMMRHLCPIRQDRNSIYSRQKKRLNKHRMTYRYSY